MIERDVACQTAGMGGHREGGWSVSRRAFIVGGVAGVAAVTVGGAAAVEERWIPGRSTMDRVLRLNGRDGTIPNVAAGKLISGAFTSPARLGRRVGWTIALPPGREASGLPVVIALHGHGADHTYAFGSHLGLQYFLAQAVRAGAPPFAIAAVDGGDTYWHRRGTGEDSGRMVLEEFLPRLRENGLNTARVGFLGWSMGGYGALLLAAQLGPDRVSAIAAESPAIWHRAQDTAPGAFDDPTDFEAHNLFTQTAKLSGIPIRIDCGTGDGFCPNARDLAAALPQRPAGGFEPGGHDLGYWRRMAPAQLAFIGRA